MTTDKMRKILRNSTIAREYFAQNTVTLEEATDLLEFEKDHAQRKIVLFFLLHQRSRIRLREEEDEIRRLLEWRQPEKGEDE